MKTSKSKPVVQTLYTCADQIVQVVRKITGLRRWPQHDYPCVIFLLKPRDGHRVCVAANGDIEFMPNYCELRAMLLGIKPDLAAVLPADFRSKPRKRQVWWQRRNHARCVNRRRA